MPGGEVDMARGRTGVQNGFPISDNDVLSLQTERLFWCSTASNQYFIFPMGICATPTVPELDFHALNIDGPSRRGNLGAVASAVKSRHFVAARGFLPERMGSSRTSHLAIHQQIRNKYQSYTAGQMNGRSLVFYFIRFARPKGARPNADGPGTNIIETLLNR